MSTPSLSQLLMAADQAAQQNQPTQARRLLRRALNLDSRSAEAHLALVKLARSRPEAEHWLNRLAAIHPTHNDLPALLQWIDRQWPPEAATAPRLRRSQPALFSLGVLAGLGLLALAFAFGPPVAEQVYEAVAPSPTYTATPTATPTPSSAQMLVSLQADLAADETQDLAALQTAYLTARLESEPQNRRYRRALAEHYLAQGRVAQHADNLNAAEAWFREAETVDPGLAGAGLELGRLALYRQSLSAIEAEDWPRAAQLLTELQTMAPNYPGAKDRLYDVHVRLGQLHVEAGKYDAARYNFNRAIELRPLAVEARQADNALTQRLIPTPTPTPVPPRKRVVVDISQQMTYAYLDDQLVYSFVSSTGEPGRGTATGRFEILNKIPMAYASTWNLDMPNWLGIYWVGPIQNGFHGPPTVRHTGYTLWEGYLGTPVSYGCVILSHADSRTLYEWVDIGTPVIIQP